MVKQVKGKAMKSKAESGAMRAASKQIKKAESESSDSESAESSDESVSDDEEIAEIGMQNLEDEKEKKRKKRNRGLDDGSEAFSGAMNALLDTKLKVQDRKAPILSRSKKQFKDFESDKLELKARKLLSAKKKAKLAKGRVSKLIPEGEGAAMEALLKERKLKKTAQKGVIKLFNAILVTQTEADGFELGRDRFMTDKKKREALTEVSKETFLDMVKDAA